jgi:hypothetical protein
MDEHAIELTGDQHLVSRLDLLLNIRAYNRGGNHLRGMAVIEPRLGGSNRVIQKRKWSSVRTDVR